MRQKRSRMGQHQNLRVAGKSHPRDGFQLIQMPDRAGSTAAPNKLQMQDSWSKALPVLQQMIAAIRQIDAVGGDSTAERELVRETAARFDETIDVDRFLPARTTSTSTSARVTWFAHAKPTDAGRCAPAYSLRGTHATRNRERNTCSHSGSYCGSRACSRTNHRGKCSGACTINA